MTGRLTFFFRDHGGKEGTTSFLYPLTLTIGEIIARANDGATVLKGISNASLFAARFSIPVPLPPPNPAQIGSDCYSRLIVLCRNEQTYGAVTIPSPSGLSYLSQGPHRGYKVDATNAPSAALLEAIRAQFAFQLLPYGNVFPSSEIQAALMVTE